MPPEIVQIVLAAIISALFAIVLRRTAKSEERLGKKIEDVKKHLKMKVGVNVCEERRETCGQIREANAKPIYKALTELADTIQKDRKEFWRVINSHSHEGLEKNSRVVRPTG